MVKSGVCIFSEGSNYSQGSNVEENLNRLLEFIKRQEDSLKNTASALSSPDSKNPKEVADEPNVSSRPETDTVAAQTQTDSSEQKPDSGERFKSRINETLIAALKNENYYLGLQSIEDLLTSGEFEISSVSPAYIQLIANAILTIVNRGIESEQLQFVNYFLTQYPACLGILDRAISMKSTQTPEALKEWLTDLFIRIRDQVVQFSNLVTQTQDISIRASTPSEIIGQNNLYFLKLIYPKITTARSQVDVIIQGVFAEPFNQWVQANITRINEIARPILEKVDEGKIAQDLTRLQELRERHYKSRLGLTEEEWREYNLIKAQNKELKDKLLGIESILDNYNQDLSSNGPDIYQVSTEYKTKYNDILTSIGSLLSKLDQIIDFQIP